MSSFRSYAVRVRAQRESQVDTALRARGYLPFLPTYKERVQWSDRIKTRESALFPGYLFCAFDEKSPLPVLTTPGVLGVVNSQNRFLPIAEEELDGIRRALDGALTVRPWTAFQRGDRVRITCGPLAGLTGEVVRVKNDWRLILRINLLNRAVAVDLDQRWVMAAPRVASR